MRRNTLVAVIVVATVGLLLTGVAVHGEEHGRETRFIWCSVLACVYAAVLFWLVDVSGVIRVVIRSRRCSCERRYSTTAAYAGGHSRGCPLADAGSVDQQPAGPALATAAVQTINTEFGGQRIRAMVRRTRNDDDSRWMFLSYNPMRFADRSLRRWLLYFGLTRRQLYHVYDELRFRPDRDAPWPVEERHG